TNAHLPAGVTTPNASGYVAIELYNPYPTPIDVSTWQLATISRASGATYPLTLTMITDFSKAVTVDALHGVKTAAPALSIPANGYMLLENFADDGSGTATYRPPSSGLPPTGAIANSDGTSRGAGIPLLVKVYVPNLSAAIPNELVILKHRKAIWTAPVTAPPADGDYTYNDDPAKNPNYLYDMVPVDSFDFTGINPGASNAASVWHYARACTSGSSTNSLAWHCVYPGRYDGSQGAERQQGTVSD